MCKLKPNPNDIQTYRIKIDLPTHLPNSCIEAIASASIRSNSIGFDLFK